MFSHIMIGSNDIDRSQRFYDAVLAVFGAKPATRNQAPTGHMRLFYQAGGNMFCVSEPINGEPATASNGSTIGFKCDSPEQAKHFHDVAVANGGTSIEDPPGVRSGSARCSRRARGLRRARGGRPGAQTARCSSRRSRSTPRPRRPRRAAWGRARARARC